MYGCLRTTIRCSLDFNNDHFYSNCVFFPGKTSFNDAPVNIPPFVLFFLFYLIRYQTASETI
jgi:hypothetical protein